MVGPMIQSEPWGEIRFPVIMGKRGMLSFPVNLNPEDVCLELQRVMIKGIRMKSQSRRQEKVNRKNWWHHSSFSGASITLDFQLCESRNSHFLKMFQVELSVTCKQKIPSWLIILNQDWPSRDHKVMENKSVHLELCVDVQSLLASCLTKTTYEGIQEANKLIFLL